MVEGRQNWMRIISHFYGASLLGTCNRWVPLIQQYDCRHGTFCSATAESSQLVVNKLEGI